MAEPLSRARRLLCAVAFAVYAFYPERTVLGERGRVVGPHPSADEEETR